MSLLAACANEPASNAPEARDGFLDLSSVDFGRGDQVKLVGKWRFYWKRLYAPADFRAGSPASGETIQVPSAWNGREANGKIIGGDGFATFRLRVRLPEKSPRLALLIPEQGTSHRVWVDGRLLGENGRVGVSAKETRPQFRSAVARLDSAVGEIEIVVQIANFVDQSGGFWYPLVIGEEKRIVAARTRSWLTDGVLWGALLIMGLYHMALFLLRRGEGAALYFAFTCYFVAARMLVSGERILIQNFPDFPFDWAIRIEYIGFYLGVTSFVMFAATLFGAGSRSWIARTFLTVGLLGAALVLFAPVSIFTRTILFFHAVTLCAALYVIGLGIAGVWNGRDSALAFLVGSGLLFVAIFNDILHNLEIIYTGYVTPFGLFLFIFAQSAMLAGRFSRAFHRVEELSVELETKNEETQELNRALDHKVRERTQQLTHALTEIRRMNEFMRRINETGDLEKVMQQVMSYVQEHYGIDGIIIHRVDRARGALVPIQSSHPPAAPAHVPRFARSHVIPLDSSGGFVSETIRRKKRFYMADCRRVSPFAGDRELIDNLELTSILLVPLVVQGEVIAMVSLTGYQQHMKLGRDEIKSIEGFCEQIAGAVYSTSLLNEVRREREKSDGLLLNILPAPVADELKSRGEVRPLGIESVTVFFTDFVGFTRIAADISPADLVQELDACFTQFDEIAERHHLEKLKTIGDAYMCAGGLPEPNRTHPVDACLAALEFQALMERIRQIKTGLGESYWSLRIGLHSGPVTAGVVGKNKFAYDIWGDTVNLASRMESGGEAGRVNISAATHALIGEFFDCHHRGKIEAKGKGLVDMYFLDRIRPELADPDDPLRPNARFKELYARLQPARL